MTAHSVSGKGATGGAASLFADRSIGASDNTISNANNSPSANSTSVSFQDFGSTFSEMLSGSSSVSPKEDKPAIVSKNAAGDANPSEMVQSNDSSKESSSYRASSGLLASLRARSNVERGLHDADTSSSSAAVQTHQTVPPDQPASQAIFSGDSSAGDHLSWQDQASTFVPPTTDDGSPKRESSSATIAAIGNATASIVGSDIQPNAANEAPADGALRPNDTLAPTGKAGDSVGKTESAIPSLSKDVQAFTLVLSKAASTNSSGSSSEKADTVRQASTSALQPPDKAASVVTTPLTTAESTSDQSSGQEPKHGREDQNTALATATPKGEVKSAPSHTIAGSDETDPPITSVAKAVVATESARPIAVPGIAAADAAVMNPSNQASSPKESGRSLQSSEQVQPTDLQGSSMATPAKEVVMKIQGQSGETISVRLVDQGGQIQVGVRSSDPNTAASLRQDLSSLTSNLERVGWKTEATSMVPETVFTASNAKSSGDDSEGSSSRNYPESQEQSGKRKQTAADLWDETLDRQR